MDSLQVTDQQAAAVAKAPRITLEEINNSVAPIFSFTSTAWLESANGSTSSRPST